jgi:hypothetical protein
VSAEDLAGNTDVGIESNYVIDTIPPIISLIVPSPETVEYLSTYID